MRVIKSMALLDCRMIDDRPRSSSTIPARFTAHGAV
jgi:hypothetical protein